MCCTATGSPTWPRLRSGRSLLDEGTYLGSVSTYYRVLREAGESRERRRQATHPAAVKPELAADGPNQVWSWDITKLHGPAKWTYYHLYVILDIYSRYVVGWMVATRESAALAEKLIAATCAKQGIGRGQLSIHADRGSSMTSKPVALLLADLGVTQSHSRPHVSNDNPYSEAQFKTLKYRPAFPARFASIEAARAHCQDFFPWYNDEHRHGGLGLHTPADVHYGRAAAVRAERARVLDAAYLAHPERFVRKPPAPPKLPGTSWINPPPGEGSRHSVKAAQRCPGQVDRFRDVTTPMSNDPGFGQAGWLGAAARQAVGGDTDMDAQASRGRRRAETSLLRRTMATEPGSCRQWHRLIRGATAGETRNTP